jgi:hypothetical protein
LFIYLIRHFYKFFDGKAKVSQRYRSAIAVDINYQVVQIVELLKSSVDMPLTEVLYEPFDKLTNNSGVLCFHQLFYLRQFIGDMLAESQKQNIDDAFLVDFLERNNFNSLRFTQYLINNYLNHLANCKTSEARQKFLYELLGRYSHLEVGAWKYIEELPSIKDQMLTWITEELYFAAKTEKSYTYKVAKPDLSRNKNKLPINLPVAQIAYILKVQKELNLFPVNNLSEMMKMFCEHTSSAKQDNISLSSMWSKYYNVEHSTKLAVRKIIKRMLEYVDKDMEG